jgi:tripartite-type tricarboxylate transporter receptor subunit TctC
MISSLNDALVKAVSDPAIVARFKALGSLPFPPDQLTPAAHAKAFAADMPRVAELVASAGIKAAEAK